MPRKHYIITNRRILDEYTDKERIQIDGKDVATEHVRFGYIETAEDLKKYKKDPNNLIKLYPHQAWDDADITKIGDNDKGSAKFFGDLYQTMCRPEGGDLVFCSRLQCRFERCCTVDRYFRRKIYSPR